MLTAVYERELRAARFKEDRFRAGAPVYRDADLRQGAGARRIDAFRKLHSRDTRAASSSLQRSARARR